MPRRPRVVMYSVWSYKVGPPQHESVSSAWCKMQDSDEPALLIVCASEAERDRLKLELKERLGA